MTKKERKKYGPLPPKIAESDSWVMVCVDLVGPFTIRTPAKTHSLLALTMIDPATGWFEIVKATISQQHPSRICFITPGWHVTRNLSLLSLTMGNIDKFKREFKKMCDNYGIKAKPTTSHNPHNTSKCNH
jgi:hypothetical protein